MDKRKSESEVVRSYPEAGEAVSEALLPSQFSQGSASQYRSMYTSDEPMAASGGRQLQPLPAPQNKKLQVASSMARPLMAGARDQLVLQALVRAYQARGHLAAKVDPLGLSALVGGEESWQEEERWRKQLPPDADLDAVLRLPDTTFIGGGEDSLPLREIISRLEAAYCGPVGAEYLLADSYEQRQWLRQQLEPPQAFQLPAAVRTRILDKLIAARAFEIFLSSNWGSERRFGLEGCEALVPALSQLLEAASALGVDTFVMGMAHRGRLNVMANVCQAPLHKIFALFFGLPQADASSADIKYHQGTHQQFNSATTGRMIRVSLLSNPSHLEAVNPVVMGRTRAEQKLVSDRDSAKVMSILVHGDAALSGQGVVYECVQLSGLPAYTVAGTVHVVVNNQAGFTTEPVASRSSRYCTDVFRVTGTPVLHVNADEPDSVVRCCHLAAAFRQRFGRDIVIDLVSYRRHGHSEHDDPSITQPHRYKLIKKKRPVTQTYEEKLIKEGLLTKPEVQDMWTKYESIFKQEMAKAQRESGHRVRDWSDLPLPRPSIADVCSPLAFPVTGMSVDLLYSIGEAILTPPTKMDLHPQVNSLLRARLSRLKEGLIDWPTAETLAVATLLRQGFPVRFTGQDVERGTFSHRHWVLHDQRREGVKRTPLREVPGARAQLELSNSPVSEYSTLGFELGFASAHPRQLVIWEAQFGDFCNLAQVIIDQFIVAGEAKWGRPCGIVIMCPHGLEGDGPEHSSARVERFLQLCTDDPRDRPDISQPGSSLLQLRATNLQVVSCSSPANLFHVLRRQCAMPLRKPLVLLTHKALLRHPDLISSLYDIAEDTQFQRLLPERECMEDYAASVVKLLFCTGRIYYDLCEERNFQGLTNSVALARIEQLSPFPYDRVFAEVERFPNAILCWVQQEHKNQGAWSYVEPRFRSVLPNREVLYVGRATAAAPATGSIWRHHLESRMLLEEALRLPATTATN